MLGAYSLSGVIVTPRRRIVLLKETASGRIVRLKQGEQFEGWTLAEVAPDFIVLESGGRREVIVVRDRTPGGKPSE